MTHHRHTGNRRSIPSPLLSLLAALGIPEAQSVDADSIGTHNPDLDNLNRLAADMESKRTEWDARERMVSMVNTFNDLLQGMRGDIQLDAEVVKALTTQLQVANMAREEHAGEVMRVEDDRNYYKQRVSDLSGELDDMMVAKRREKQEAAAYLSHPASLLKVLEYMRDQGEELLDTGDKIAVIRDVRFASKINDNWSAWGLKESKDFVESYIRGTFPSKEEIISGFPQEGEQKAGDPAYQAPYDNGFHPNPDSVDDTDTPTIPPVLDASRVIGEGVSVSPLDDTNGAVDEGDIVS